MTKKKANNSVMAAENEALQETVAALRQENAELKRKLERMNELLLAAQRARFGQKSEKTAYVLTGAEQQQLFNEAELEQEPQAEEPTPATFTVAVVAHERKKKRTQAELLAELPVEEIVYELPEKERFCPKCGGALKLIGKERVRQELNMIPESIRVFDYISCSYACSCCEKDTGYASIYKTKTPPPLMKHSLASPSSVADVMAKKYVESLPLYRQEQEWKRKGIQLSRNTLANWVIKCSQDWLRPVYDRLREHLLAQRTICADETVVQVLKEPDKPAASESRMWVYISGSQEKRQIRLFEYQPTRAGEHPKRFLAGFKGLLQTDGYAGYDKVEGVTRCGCWAHARRKWRDAMPKGATKETSQAAVGYEYCNKLFAWEKELNKHPGGRNDRPRIMRPLLDAYWAWLAELDPEPGSKLAAAAIYSRNQKEYLGNFLTHSEADISNNLAENAIRPFVVGRKNWLFCDTVKGAESSAIVYSLVETAKVNGLAPYDYLLRLLTMLPLLGKTMTQEQIDELMPWNILTLFPYK